MSAGVIAHGLVLLVLLLFLPAPPLHAEEQRPRAPTRRPEGGRVGIPGFAGNPNIGRQIFRAKGCIECHAIKGEGGSAGPDLGKIQHTHNVYTMAAIMWNHSPQMLKVMVEKGIRRPEFRGNEMVHLISYLHSLEVLGDPDLGKALFDRKGCVRCHAINGEGGKMGPDLARAHPHPPAELVGMMWNHSPTMTALIARLRRTTPPFTTPVSCARWTSRPGSWSSTSGTGWGLLSSRGSTSRARR